MQFLGKVWLFLLIRLQCTLFLFNIVVIGLIKGGTSLMTVVAKPYNTWAARRPVAGKQKRVRREKEIAAIQRWAAGKTDTIEKAPKLK
jgi:predicted peptidase